MKKSTKLYTGRLLRQILLEEDGKVESIEMCCLKPKVGNGTVLEDTPDHLPDLQHNSLAFEGGSTTREQKGHT